MSEALKASKKVLVISNRKKIISNYFSTDKYLENNLKKYDKIVICDFGHGLFSKKVISVIESKAKFICANIQTNSGKKRI